MTPVALARMIAQYRCKCCGCAECCVTCHPISLDAEDVVRIQKEFGISHKMVMNKYVKVIEGGLFIKKDDPCMFLNSDLRCSIYENRPNVCRMHPFMSNAQRDVDAFWVNSNCAAMSDFWNDEMNGNPVFKAIMDRTYDPVFLRNAYRTMERLLKKKFNMTHI